jgi:hypothetical protein
MAVFKPRAIIVAGLADLLVPLAGQMTMLAAPMRLLAQALIGFTGPIYSINVVSLRQAITPDDVLGRVNATMRFISWTLLALGSVLGGALAQLIGLGPTFVVEERPQPGPWQRGDPLMTHCHQIACGGGMGLCTHARVPPER